MSFYSSSGCWEYTLFSASPDCMTHSIVHLARCLSLQYCSYEVMWRENHEWRRDEESKEHSGTGWKGEARSQQEVALGEASRKKKEEKLEIVSVSGNRDVPKEVVFLQLELEWTTQPASSETLPEKQLFPSVQKKEWFRPARSSRGKRRTKEYLEKIIVCVGIEFQVAERKRKKEKKKQKEIQFPPTSILQKADWFLE